MHLMTRETVFAAYRSGRRLWYLGFDLKRTYEGVSKEASRMGTLLETDRRYSGRLTQLHFRNGNESCKNE